MFQTIVCYNLPCYFLGEINFEPLVTKELVVMGVIIMKILNGENNFCKCFLSVGRYFDMYVTV